MGSIKPKIAYIVPRWDDVEDQDYEFVPENKIGRFQMYKARRIVYWELENDT